MSQQVAEQSHSVERDSRGWFCLNCAWPGQDFTPLFKEARAHLRETAQ